MHKTRGLGRKRWTVCDGMRGVLWEGGERVNSPNPEPQGNKRKRVKIGEEEERGSVVQVELTIPLTRGQLPKTQPNFKLEVAVSEVVRMYTSTSLSAGAAACERFGSGGLGLPRWGVVAAGSCEPSARAP
eukprot:scaffold184058_cov28-Tisochrysis_lutea.AAC.2